MLVEDWRQHRCRTGSAAAVPRHTVPQHAAARRPAASNTGAGSCCAQRLRMHS
jgi:hypothetical protein